MANEMLSALQLQSMTVAAVKAAVIAVDDLITFAAAAVDDANATVASVAAASPEFQLRKTSKA